MGSRQGDGWHFAGCLFACADDATFKGKQGNAMDYQPPTSGCSFLMRLRSNDLGSVKTDTPYSLISSVISRATKMTFPFVFW